MAKLLIARIYLEHDPFVPVMQVAFDADEGRSYVGVVGGAIMDAMHDVSGLRYGYEVEEADHPPDIRVAPLVVMAREIAEGHRS